MTRCSASVLAGAGLVLGALLLVAPPAVAQPIQVAPPPPVQAPAPAAPAPGQLPLNPPPSSVPAPAPPAPPAPPQPAPAQPAPAQPAPPPAHTLQRPPAAAPAAEPPPVTRPAPPVVPVEPAWLPQDGAKLIALDKLTGRSETITGKVGQTLHFHSLAIVIRKCVIRPPDHAAGAAAFLDITDTAPGADTTTAFHGWMFTEFPALNMLQHPTYGIMLAGCTK